MGGGVEEAQALEEEAVMVELLVSTSLPVFWFAIYAMTAGIYILDFSLYNSLLLLRTV